MNTKGKSFLSYVTIVFFAVLLAINYHIFIVENNFAPAGLNGIATMIQYKTGFSISYMSLIVNIPLCALAYFMVEKDFATKTLVFSLTYSAAYLLLQASGTDYIKYNAQGHDTIFPVIISGVISGLVYGVCFKNNSSTGGTDIVSRYINKKNPATNFFIVTFLLNAAVAVISIFVYSDASHVDYKPVALCITYCFISNFVGNYILKGTKTAYKFTIITTHPDELAAEISKKVQHSATRVEAVGTYSGSSKSMLVCVINKHQLVEFKNILSRYDDVFAFSELVNETYGNFQYIKKERD